MNNFEQIAKVCHEVNREYCRSIGDNSQPAWEKAPDWQRKSALDGVKFSLDNPKAGPDSQHISWLLAKRVDGWRYGPIKNPEKKEHPCIVPFNELPREQQLKDKLFKTIVDAMREV